MDDKQITMLELMILNIKKYSKIIADLKYIELCVDKSWQKVKIMPSNFETIMTCDKYKDDVDNIYSNYIGYKTNYREIDNTPYVNIEMNKEIRLYKIYILRTRAEKYLNSLVSEKYHEMILDDKYQEVLDSIYSEHKLLTIQLADSL